jgi:hypothetical protein
MFLLFVTVPSSAQTPSITPSPLVGQMLGTATDSEPIVELKGYVGPTTPEMVRLYADLSLQRYLEIPRGAIIGKVQEGDPTSGPVKLYVRGSTIVVSANRLSAANAAPTLQRAVTLPRARPREGPANCDIYLLECALGQGLACLLYGSCIAGSVP